MVEEINRKSHPTRGAWVEMKYMGIMMRKDEVEAVRAMALTIAKQYCENNNLSYDRLLKQEFALIYDTAIFAQPSGVKPDGLKNDLKTQAKPTLILNNVNGNIIIKETELTRKFLSM